MVSRSLRLRSVACVLALLLAVALVPLPSPALASHSGCVPANFATIIGGPWPLSWSYDYNICDVPDIDQRKTVDSPANIGGLPNNGNCYCVPTATLNWMSHIARHGYPELAPGPDNYQLGPPFFVDRYNAMTFYQAILGGSAYMDLNPGPRSETGGCGVGPTKTVPAIKQWFNDAGLGSSFTVVYEGQQAGSTYVPRISDAALAGVWGSLVILRIGWYTESGGVLSRNGGHVVSLVKADGPHPFGDLELSIVGFKDPWTQAGADNFSQSQFVREIANAGDVTETYASGETTVERTRTRFYGYGSNTGRMDGYYAITPKYGLGDGPNHSVILLQPTSLSNIAGGPPPPPTHSRLLPGDPPVVDFAIFPHRPIQPFVVEDAEEIGAVDLLTGEVGTFSTLRGVRRLAFGGFDGHLYALVPDGIAALGRDGEVIDTISVSWPLHEIAFDEAGQLVVALDADGGQLHLFTPDGTSVRAVELPGWPGGDASLTVDPRSGDVWALPDGTATAWRVPPDGDPTTVELGDGSALTGLHAGDDERLYAIADGQVASFRTDGGAAGDTPFDGQQAHSKVRILQTWSNAEPDDEVGPEWDNVTPDDASSDSRYLLLARDRPVERVGGTHTAQALFHDDEGAVADVDIRYEVVGPGAKSGVVRTGPDGVATLSWSSDEPGEDVVTAFADLDGDGEHDDGEPLAAETVAWTPAGDASRLSGPTRFETAVAASADTFADGTAGAVVLARADDFADGLTAVPLAIDRDAPLLLSARDRLPAATLAEIERVLPAGGDVLIVGGEAVISASVDEALRAAGFTTQRHAGRDRFETSVAVARALGDPGHHLLVTGLNFADALAVGPAAVEANAAILLTAGERMPTSVAAYLDEHGGTADVAVGGPAARAAPDLPAVVGADRVATAVTLAEAFFPDPLTAGLASSLDFPDGLTGGAHVARHDGPVLLTPRSGLADPVDAYLRGQPGIATVFLYGGDAALSPAVHTALTTALGG